MLFQKDIDPKSNWLTMTLVFLISLLKRKHPVLQKQVQENRPNICNKSEFSNNKGI
jgi:hypothetical protein